MATTVTAIRRDLEKLKAQLSLQPLPSPREQALSREHAAERAKCAADPVHFIDSYCRTYDPRTAGKSLPFKLWPRQVEFIRWLQAREAAQEGGICEKSRDVGVSFLCAAYSLHGFLFKPGYKVGFGSRKFQYVDTLGDLDSIFEKIRFMLRNLPTWLLPRGFNHGKHSCYARILNPESGASITGEGGDEIGRGGRCSIYFVDEAAHIERPHLADSGLAATTNVRIDVSTPNGQGNPFYTKRFSGVFPVFTFHWRDDPRKTDEWAERTKKEKGPVIWASQYDIDYTASLEGICIPAAWVRAAVNFSVPTKSARCTAGLDIGEEGNDPTVFIPRHGPVVGQPESWGKQNTTQTAWRARDAATIHGVAELCYDSVGVGCLDGSTLICGVPVAELDGQTKVRTLLGYSQSSQGYRKGVADLYRVRTQSGRTVVVTASHRFLTPTGWLPLSHLSIGFPIAADDTEDENYCWGKPISSWDRYSRDHCPCVGQFPERSADAVGKAWQRDELASLALSLLFQYFGLPSTEDFWGRIADLDYASRRQLLLVFCELLPTTRRTLQQYFLTTSQIRTGRLSDLMEYRLSGHFVHGRHRFRFCEESMRQCMTANRDDGRPRFDFATLATNSRQRSNHVSFSLRYSSHCWDDIQAIEWVRKGEFYDFHVPVWQHYAAAGLWHHNSGVKGTFNSAEKPLSFKARAINVGESPTETVWPDNQTSKEKFFNLKAELWWCLRSRFEKTYEAVTQGVKHKPEDMISIPNNPQLIAEISIPLYEHTESGKIRIESKAKLAARGIKSPDFAEALVLSEASFVLKLKEFWFR